jgi:hypothetical protein
MDTECCKEDLSRDKIKTSAEEVLETLMKTYQ